MIEHPHPTLATAKLLYARALRCAHPDCEQPLYREDERSGAWTLNSRICHIDARSENGPRWNSAQTSDENRSDTNLLLMCLTHAYAIDDPANVSSYPEATLRDWKKAQITEHRSAARGWPLTEKMAEKALLASFPDINVSVSNSAMNMGGKGGKSPGSGGGGGSAIGANSRAGDGGHGGNIHVYGDHVDLSSAQATLNDIGEELSNSTPGAGGGGAEAVGDFSVGGRGGDGGEIHVGKLRVEAGQYRVNVGRGATLPGEFGGTSFLERVEPSGQHTRIGPIARAARSGDSYLPGNIKVVDQRLINSGFRVNCLGTCDDAHIDDGVISVKRLGWSWIALSSLPTEMVVIFAVVYTKPFAEACGFYVSLFYKNEEFARIAIPCEISNSLSTVLCACARIGAMAHNAGLWSLVAHNERTIFSEYEFKVILENT